MISLYRSTACHKHPLGKFETAEFALAYVAKTFGETFTEEDADHPGCFDIFVYATGDVLVVEPENFRL